MYDDYCQYRESTTRSSDSSSSAEPVAALPGSCQSVDVCAVSGDELRRLFELEWRHKRPIVVRNVHSRMQQAMWRPEWFAERFADLRVDLINCSNQRVVCDVPMSAFWSGFDDAACHHQSPAAATANEDDTSTTTTKTKTSRCLVDAHTGKPLTLKLKDWPTVDDFKHLLPVHYDDLMAHMPLAEYTSRGGALNMCLNLPEHFCKPDLGPKLYIAYSSANAPREATTNLHVDVSDAVNVLVYVGVGGGGRRRQRARRQTESVSSHSPSLSSSSSSSSSSSPSSPACNTAAAAAAAVGSDEKKKKKTKMELKRERHPLCRVLEKAQCEASALRRLESGERAGALWHIFDPRDAPTIRSFLAIVSAILSEI